MKRIYHPWTKWECYKAGFYNTTPPDGIMLSEAKKLYANFLKDDLKFEKALERVISEWINSCEQFLTNPNINRIAWLGQASACISLRLPSIFRGGFNLLTLSDQKKANLLAERYLRLWEKKYENISKNGKNVDIQLEFQM